MCLSIMAGSIKLMSTFKCPCFCFKLTCIFFATLCFTQYNVLNHTHTQKKTVEFNLWLKSSWVWSHWLVKWVQRWVWALGHEPPSSSFETTAYKTLSVLDLKATVTNSSLLTLCSSAPDGIAVSQTHTKAFPLRGFKAKLFLTDL